MRSLPVIRSRALGRDAHRAVPGTSIVASIVSAAASQRPAMFEAPRHDIDQEAGKYVFVL